MNRPPEPPPEGVLIEAARTEARLSVREAARRAAISEGWWRQVVKGYQSLSGGAYGAVRDVPADTVARMATATGRITPEQMAGEGQRPDAAEAMRQAALPSRVVPPPRREDVDFSGGDPEGLRPWRQQVLRQLYDALGILPRLGPGELPEPRELPGIEEALASMPRDWAPFTAEKEAAAWNDRALSLHERLTVIAVMRWAIARMDAGERDRRTGLIATAHNYPASAWIPSLVSVGRKALRASP